MEKRIEVPDGFDVAVKENTVILKHNGKEESKRFRAKVIELGLEGRTIVIKGLNKKKRTRAILNTTAKCIENLISGLIHGYEAKMRIIHLHFPMNVQVSGREVIISNFLGEKKPRKVKIVGKNTNVEVKGKDIIISGPNKEDVGQTAANIEISTKVREKDLRIFQDSIYLVEKAHIKSKQK